MTTDESIIAGAMVIVGLSLAGFLGYMAGRDSNMRYGKCVQQVTEVRYVCTDQTGHGACIEYGLRPVPLCIAWER